jgi:hypothetical protein
MTSASRFPLDPVTPEAVAAAVREVVSVPAMLVRNRGQIAYCEQELQDRLRRA